MTCRFHKAITHCLLAIATAIVICFHSTADADHIEYGDFSGTSVMYLDVEEVANSPGDQAPLYGPPQIVVDTLEFDPTKSYHASATGGGLDITDGRLSFTFSDAAVTSFVVNGSGYYSLSGNGANATSVEYRSRILQLNVLEVDGVPVASPLFLPGIEVHDSFDLSNGTQSETPWMSLLTYDVNAALTNANVAFQFGATRFDVIIDNQLISSSETSSFAQIGANHFAITPTTVSVPEPSGVSLAWLVSGTIAMIGRRCRNLPPVVGT